MSTMKHQSEAEAVLSSVRRLVSEEVTRAVAGPTTPLMDKLLLTPALRVDGASARPAAPVNAPLRRPPSELELRIAELERAVESQSGHWEPDGSEAIDEETPKEFVFRHGAKEPAPQSTPSWPAAENDEVSEGEEPRHDRLAAGIRVIESTEIEEDQLREIVAQMVREELQGALGERITRNVRKLVRSEIHRAFLMRDIR